MVSDDDDPRAPYKVYEGRELKGTYATRAEARRAQQQLAESEPDRHFIIRDLLNRVAFEAGAATPPPAAITSTWRRTRSAANAGSRSYSPPAKRYSTATF